MNVVLFHADVANDLNEASRSYERQKPGLGRTFRDAFDEALGRVVGSPLRFTPVEAETQLPSYADLPGGDLVAAGLEDLRRGVESVPALLARIGAPRLRQLKIEVPASDSHGSLPEHRLYELLARQHGDNAHSRYNALIRRLVSFTRAVACAR